ncbi:MAG: PHP domain-containing protein [Clostridiales bacterium]|jgi:putative hydrolase|nr:PHP domain-containing protein [Clostridiales bacterium]
MDIKEIKQKYKILFDYHTHTVYSRVGPYLHGKGRIIDNARAASRAGLRELAITDHGPTDFYGLSISDLPKMREDIAKAEKKYPRLKIHLGVEADITDSQTGIDVSPEDFGKFDFVNAGYHYVPNCHMILNWMSFHIPFPGILKKRLRRQNTARIVRALKNNNIRILTHPGDKAFIDEHAVAKACEETGTLVEINARHRHPDRDDLQIYKMYDVSFVISSDAHRPKHVGRYAESMNLALEAGIDPSRIVNIKIL